LTLLSFVYTYCTDPIGCPLAYETFDTVKRRALADPQLRGRVRLVSLSFDPANDTPDAMRVYGGEQARSTELPWHFLTTYSAKFLKPILDGFGQDVEIELDANGAPTRARTHMLKVFLLDQRGQVREIYSAAFLHPEVILNDLRTLALESAGQAIAKTRPAAR
jgi:cytochrome oxidase Cu insertion factor (SCO1/SenC/PrrC family)